MQVAATRAPAQRFRLRAPSTWQLPSLATTQPVRYNADPARPPQGLTPQWRRRSAPCSPPRCAHLLWLASTSCGRPGALAASPPTRTHSRGPPLVAQVEASSARNGIGLVKLMGRQSGFIAMQASMASGGRVGHRRVVERGARGSGQEGMPLNHPLVAPPPETSQTHTATPRCSVVLVLVPHSAQRHLPPTPRHPPPRAETLATIIQAWWTRS